MPVTAHPASQRAADPLALRALRVGFRALRALHRPTAAKLATRLFSRPRRHARPGWEREILAGAERRVIRHQDRRVACLRWDPAAAPAGGEAPTALLVHGWEGRGTQLGRFVDPLRAAGFRVVAFDHVGHGDSDGRACSLPTMRDTLRSISAELPGEERAGPDLVVAHSMGCFAATLLLADEWRTTRAVYISPPDDLLVYFGRYLDLVTGDDELLPDMIALMERRFGERVEDFEFRRLVETLDQDLLVLHSRDDPDVPIEAGRLVAAHWAGSRMIELEGLGHRRILKDPSVVAAVVAFARDRLDRA
ncbi:MAG: alpha/beta fold hydrolase [Planctomycetota bacterium]|nr:alpha/beta fold hydrolase [Planctomycetota bacterium]